MTYWLAIGSCSLVLTCILFSNKIYVSYHKVKNDIVKYKNDRYEIIKYFSFNEIISIVFINILFYFDKKYSKSILINNFMSKHNFSSEAKKHINKTCMSFYFNKSDITLYDFLEIINNLSSEKLEKINNFKKNNFFTIILNKIKENERKELADNIYILSLPYNLMIQNQNRYDLTLYWNNNFVLADNCIYTVSDWNIIFVVGNDESTKKFIINVIINLIDVKSKNNNKTVSECSQTEIINEVFNQLRLSIPILTRSFKGMINKSFYEKNSSYNTKQNVISSTKLWNNRLFFTKLSSDDLVTPDENIFDVVKFIFLLSFILYIFKRALK